MLLCTEEKRILIAGVKSGPLFVGVYGQGDESRQLVVYRVVRVECGEMKERYLMDVQHVRIEAVYIHVHIS